MTRILVLGSSHVGALRRADDAFRDRFPGVETEYFAVKAPMLRRGKVEGGAFRPHIHNDEETGLLENLNGRTEVDLGQYDKVLVVGFRAHPLDIVPLFETHAMLGREGDGRRYRISAGFVGAWLDEMAADWAQDIEWRFGAAQSCVFTAGPYPAESLVERSDEIALAGRFKAFRDLPEADEVFDRWSLAIETAAGRAGLGYLAQPADTLAGPYATRAQFAQGGTAADGEAMDQGDHRHMNADFGLKILEQFAIQHLDQHPRPA